MTPGRVHFIGAGPGDPELITLKGRRIIEAAGLVLYAGSLVPVAVVAGARGRVVDSSDLNLVQTHALIREYVLAGQDVARVHTGDPSLFGAVREQARLLEDDGISWEIVPGVTAAMAAAARAKVVFTVPERTQTLILTRADGRTPVPERERLRLLAGHGASLAIYLSARLAPAVQADLLAGGLSPDTMVVVGHRVGHPDERVLTVALANLGETVAREGFSRQTVFLVLPGEDGRDHVSRLYDEGFGHGFRQARREQGPAVYAFTRMGAASAQRVAQELGGILFLPSRLTGEFGGRDFESIQTLMAEVYHHHPAHVFVGAAGIAVRAVAPHLGSKATDPAVVVCDQRGEHVVSLLSGHLGGGNDLARRVAKITNGRAVITTASDVEGTPALDVLARDLGLLVADGEKMRAAQAVLAEGGRLRVFDPENILLAATEDSGNLEAVAEDDAPEVRVQVRIPSSEDRALLLVPKGLAVGVGCRRGTPAGEIQSAVQTVLDEAGLHPKSVVCLASVDLKMDEAGLLAAAKALEAEVRFFSASELGAIDAPHPSAMVHKHVGVQSVCEAAAILAGKAGRLIVTKKVFGRVTVAVAE